MAVQKINEADRNTGDDFFADDFNVIKNVVDNNADELTQSQSDIQTNATAITAKIAITSIVDDLTSTVSGGVLSHNQGKVLKGLIDQINTLLSSDENTLDSIQEIVDYIQINKSDLENLNIAAIAGLQAALDSLTAQFSDLKEENMTATLVEPIIVNGLYTFSRATGMDYLISISEDTTFTMPSLEIGQSIVFTVELNGDFDPSWVNTDVYGDIYDGTIGNLITIFCKRKANGTQENIAIVSNLS